jgi:hypothetical protein
MISTLGASFSASFGAFPDAYFLSYLLFSHKVHVRTGLVPFYYFSLCVALFRTKFTCERGWYLFLFLTLRCFLLHEVHVRTGLILSLLHVSVFPPSRSKFTRERGCFLFLFSIGTILLLARGTCWDLYRFTFLHSCHVSGSIPFHVLHRCHVSSAFYHVHAMLCFGLLY